MDFVVAGFGIGALLALSGFAVWEFAGSRSFSQAAWKVQGGAALMMAGVVLWAITVAALLAGVDDSLGWRLISLTALVGLAASGGLIAWYRRAVQPQPRRALQPPDAAPGEATVDEPELPSEPGLALAVAAADTETPPADGPREAAESELEPETEGEPSTPEPAVVMTEGEASVEESPTVEEEIAVAGASEDPDRVTFGDDSDQVAAGEAPAFESPLLADLEHGAEVDEGAAFESPLLADLDPAADAAGDAGLAEEAVTEDAPATEPNGRPAEPGSKELDDQADEPFRSSHFAS